MLSVGGVCMSCINLLKVHYTLNEAFLFTHLFEYNSLLPFSGSGGWLQNWRMPAGTV